MSFITIFRRDSGILTKDDRSIITKESVLEAISKRVEYTSIDYNYYVYITIDDTQYGVYITENTRTPRVGESKTFIDIQLSSQEYEYLKLKCLL